MFFYLFNNPNYYSHSSARHYVGSLTVEVVATSTVILGAGVAGIYNVETLPEARLGRL
jgi:hypothetical protein